MNSYIHPGYHKPRWEAVHFQLPETSALSSHSPPCPQEATMVTADQLHEYVPVTLTQASTVHDHIHVDLFNKCLSYLWSAEAGPAAGVDLQAILYRRPGHSQGSYPRASWNPSLQILTDKVLWETNAVCGFLTVRGVEEWSAPNLCVAQGSMHFCFWDSSIGLYQQLILFIALQHSIGIVYPFFQMMDNWATSKLGLAINIPCKSSCEQRFSFL